MELQYRKDIDGLRAVAVFLVVIFHVHPRQATGGFIGVDVFFVISGFLITGLICSGLRDNRFSLFDFYARRIRRIFPALAVVLATCVVLRWLLLLPYEYRDLGKHIAASATFIANFTLWYETGYFDQPAELKPVLHLWSLGIEEQFYLFWPALILLVRRWRRGPLVVAGAILALSFIWNLVLSRTSPAAAFFLPLTRFWELMVGSILALSLPNGISHVMGDEPSDRTAAIIRDGASILGALMICSGAAVIHGNGYSAAWALLPTVGAALLIAAGPGALVNSRILSRTPIIRLGLISYSLYLWHWPVLVFFRHYRLTPPSDLDRWGAIIVSVALAALTYRFVETPIRRGAPFALKTAGAAVAMIMVAFVGISIFATNGYADRFPKEIAILFKDEDNTGRVFLGRGLCAVDDGAPGYRFTRQCDRPSGDGKLVVVWGDSNGSGLMPGLIELERARKDLRVEFFLGSGCPPFFIVRQATRSDLCRSDNRSSFEQIKSIKPDTIILAGNWLRYDGISNPRLVEEGMTRETVARLKSLGIKHVVAIGQMPLWKHDPPKLLARQYLSGHGAAVAASATVPMRDSKYVEPLIFASDRRMRQWFSSAGATFISPLSTMCNEQGCLLTVPGLLDPMDRDGGGHLSIAGSMWFVKQHAREILGE